MILCRKCNIILMIVLILVFGNLQQTKAAESNWYWYYSNEYITQFIDTNSIKIIRDYNGNIDRIDAWIKTTYSYAGAESTIKNYELTDTISFDQLNYSMERVCIKPKPRQIASKQEVFYNSDGVVLWSGEHTDYSLKWLEIRPRSSNEREFSIIIDETYNNGNLQEFEIWKSGENRWIGLSSIKMSDGSVKNTWFDNMSIVLDYSGIYFWLYTEINRDECIIEKKYSRWFYNISANTLRANMLSEWEIAKGWTVDDKSINGKPTEPVPGSNGEYWCQKIKEYVNENSEYVNRYKKAPKL